MIVSPLMTKSPLKNIQYFSRRDIMPNKKDILWKIESGVVRVTTWLEDGTIIPLGIWGPGDIVSKNLSGCDPYQIECLLKVEAIMIPISEYQGLQEVLLKHILEVEKLMLIRGNKKVETMLYQLLNWLAIKFGLDVENGKKMINLGLTHQDLAELIGATRVTITRSLSQLEQQGLIQRLNWHRIVLSDVDIWHYEI